MPLPSPLVGLTIRATVIAADNSPVVGATVTLTPTVPATSPAGDVMIAPVDLSQVSASDGTVQWTNVLATDSPGLSNRVPYRVTIAKDGQLLQQPYLVELLTTAAVAGVLRLDDVAAANLPAPLASYLLTASLGSVGGPAGPLDSNGKVPTSQLPAGSGGGVESVTAADATIVVAGTATNPTVRVGAVPQAQVTNLVTDLAGKETGGAAAAAMSAHLAASDPHSQYLTAAEGNAAYDATGAASSAITAHLAAGDPHSQYLTATEGDAAYAPLAHKHHFELLLDAFAFKAMTGHYSAFGETASPAQNAILFVLCPVSPGVLISTVSVANGGAASYSATGIPAQFRCYDFDGVLLGTTPDDNTLWSATGWRAGNVAVPFTAPSNGLMYIGMSFGGFTGAAPQVMSGTVSGAILSGLAGGKRLAIFDSGISSLPSSFNPATLGVATDWVVLAGVK